jgi:hypothetical protein
LQLGTRLYDFKNIFAEKFGAFDSKYCLFVKKWIMVVKYIHWFSRKTILRKLSRIAENSDHDQGVQVWENQITLGTCFKYRIGPNILAIFKNIKAVP